MIVIHCLPFEALSRALLASVLSVLVLIMVQLCRVACQSLHLSVLPGITELEMYATTSLGVRERVAGLAGERRRSSTLSNVHRRRRLDSLSVAT